jgi:hypothetical protein
MSKPKQATWIYISLGDFERHDDQRFLNEELNEWINGDVLEERQKNYAKWGVRRPPYLAGIYLYPEQATVFKLKFGA